MRTRILTVIVLSLVIAGLSGCRTWPPAGVAAASMEAGSAHSDPAAARTIAVTGEAEVRVVPDEVILTLGVETVNKDLSIAKAQNDDIVEGLLALAKEYDVPPRLVQTDYIGIEPRWDDTYSRKGFVGYFVRKTVVVTLRELDGFEAFLGDVLESGATHVHGIQFRTTELRTHRDQARALAIRAAAEKAQAMAAELNESVAEPISIREEYSGWWSPYASWWGGHWGGAMSQNVIQQSGGAGYEGEGTVAPGQIAVSARVSVTFALR